MRQAGTANHSDGGPVEVSASILGKGPAGLYIKKAAEGKKDRGRERVGYHRTEFTCGDGRQIASPQSSRQAHRDRRILQSAQKHR
jgi:hypothetical protein